MPKVSGVRTTLTIKSMDIRGPIAPPIRQLPETQHAVPIVGLPRHIKATTSPEHLTINSEIYNIVNGRGTEPGRCCCCCSVAPVSNVDGVNDGNSDCEIVLLGPEASMRLSCRDDTEPWRASSHVLRRLVSQYVAGRQ